MCEGVGLALGFKGESVRARYMGHVISAKKVLF